MKKNICLFDMHSVGAITIVIQFSMEFAEVPNESVEVKRWVEENYD